MTLTKLLVIISILALIYTLIMRFGLQKTKHLPLLFLQAFCGILFIISGWVKIIDPMGTGFKVQQYFAEFQAAFEPTWMSFLDGMWPWLSDNAFLFAVVTIVLEILLGIALLIGYVPKLTSWIFFILVLFFTVLTGFTYLTGYVPSDSTFFNFSSWGAYEATNMRVTDCGCFGDFIKLEPKTSFFKDVFLLIPSILFLIYHQKFNRILTPSIRSIIMIASTVGLVLYAMSNYVWDLPHTDFRPFKEGVHVVNQKNAELEASGQVEILAYKLKDLEQGTIVELPYEQFMANYKLYADKSKWESLGPVMGEPAIPSTKLSEMAFIGKEGYDISDETLSKDGYQFMIVSYKIKATEQVTQVTVTDTSYTVDTLTQGDSLILQRGAPQLSYREVRQVEYQIDPSFAKKYRSKIVPLSESAADAGIPSFALAGAASEELCSALAEEVGAKFPIYEADDILLKTIVRSNPGVVLFKDGVILKKWHYQKLPTFTEIQQKYMQ